MTSRLEERFYLDEFLARMPGIRFKSQGDRPDFVLADAGGDFALEITRVFCDVKTPRAPSEAMANESRRRTFIQKAAANYYKQGGLPLHVSILFGNGDVRDIEMDDLVSRLIAHRPTDENRVVRMELCPHDDPSRYAPYATLFLQALCPDTGNYMNWTVVNNSVGWRGTLTAEGVQPMIAAKAKKLSAYREINSRVALLLYADVTRASGMMDWSDSESSLSAHGFDAVYLYLHGRNKALRIA